MKRSGDSRSFINFQRTKENRDVISGELGVLVRGRHVLGMSDIDPLFPNWVAS